jgi:hypothetical protein
MKPYKRKETLLFDWTMAYIKSGKISSIQEIQEQSNNFLSK